MQPALRSDRRRPSASRAVTFGPTQFDGTSPWPDTADPAACPDCETRTINAQGLADCPDCDWSAGR